MDDLDPVAVHQRLARAGCRIGAPLVLVSETGSTNDDAKAAAREGAPHGATFVADAQSKGRGQGGNAWHSPAGQNLYVSTLLRPTAEMSAAALAPVTLAVGLAVLRALRGVLPDPRAVRLKWPNDVWIEDKKAAGILVEGSHRGARVDHLVVGIGINVHARSFPPQLVPIATSLALEGARDLDRAEILVSVLVEIEAAFLRFTESGLSSFMGELRERDALRGREVEVSLPDGGTTRGRGAGIDATGCLLVEGVDGVLAVRSGRVEIVPASESSGD